MLFADKQLGPHQSDEIFKQIKSNRGLCREIFELITQKTLVRCAFASSLPELRALSED